MLAQTHRHSSEHTSDLHYTNTSTLNYVCPFGISLFAKTPHSIVPVVFVICFIISHWLCPAQINHKGCLCTLYFWLSSLLLLWLSSLCFWLVCFCYWLTGAVASSVVKQKLQQVILNKQKQAALERTNSNTLSAPPVPYRWHKKAQEHTQTKHTRTCTHWEFFFINSKIWIEYKLLLDVVWLFVCCVLQKAGSRPQFIVPASGLVSLTAILWEFRGDAATQSR